jgi:hypothetical protein
MFITNKYSKCYYSIINRAKSRILLPNTYVEKHHIIPKSFGGSNLADNLVKLTAREHFICHLLLPKMTSGKLKTKMVYACWRLCTTNKTGYKINSNTYARLKTERAAVLSETAGPTHPNRGRKTGRTSETFTDEWKANISKANTGKATWNKGVARTDDERAKISATRKQRAADPTWNVRPPCSDEKANKIKLANMGKRWVHKKATKERKYINPSLVAEYLITGWDLGLGPKS